VTERLPERRPEPSPPPSVLADVGLSREQKLELIGGISGAAIAYAGVALGAALGWLQLGVLLLVVTIPAGVILGWCVAKLLKLAVAILDE
jgi:hypothetical protein